VVETFILIITFLFIITGILDLDTIGILSYSDMEEVTTSGDSITPGVSDIQILGTWVTTIVLVGCGLVTTGGDIQIFVVHITEIGDGDGIQHFVTT
jgi:hypothetical protein